MTVTLRDLEFLEDRNLLSGKIAVLMGNYALAQVGVSCRNRILCDRNIFCPHPNPNVRWISGAT